MANKRNEIYFCLLGLVLLVLTEKAAGQTASQIKVAIIGGQAVYEDEFRFYMDECRAGCIAYFTAKYGTYDQGDFWEHRFGDETPGEWLKAAAIKKSRDDRIILQFIQCCGILKDFQFSQLDSFAYMENRRRQASVAAGKPVYGVLEFDRHIFYTYLLSNSLIQAKQHFSSQHPVSSAVLRKYYERIKDKAFKFVPTRVIAVQQLKEYGPEKFKVTFGPATAKVAELEWGDIYTKSMRLTKAGQKVSFKGTNENEYILKCLSFKDNGYMPFADALENVKLYYAEKQIRKIMDGYLQAAQMVINKPIYNAINVE